MAVGASGEEAEAPLLARSRPSGAYLCTVLGLDLATLMMAVGASGEEAEAPVLARSRPSGEYLCTVLGLVLHDTMADWIKLHWDWSTMAQQR